MKKTKITTKLLALMFAGALSAFSAKGQTLVSGTASNGCTTVASGTGSNATAVGCGANAGSGADNTIVGNTAGSAMTGTANVCMGYSVGVSLTSGNNNTFVGAGSGVSTTSVSANTFVGAGAGSLANASNNVFMGVQAGANCGVSSNVGIGNKALYTLGGGYAWGNTSNNVAVGNSALYNTITAGNTAVGTNALYNNTNAANTALGYEAGYTYAGGTNNTFVGYTADADSNGRFNASAIGNGAIAKKNNSLYLGNTSTLNGVFAYGPYNNISDGRFKTNITENVKGLAFIKKLRPVTYNMDTKKLDDFQIQNLPDSVKKSHQKGMNFEAASAIVHSGFIAQEVEKVAKEVGFKSTIVSAPSNSTDNYALNYAEIVVPLVKAVQEQQSMIEDQQKQIAQLTQLVNAMGGLNNSTSDASRQAVQLSNATAVVLNQNVPNPFAEQTIINYSIPQTASVARILFYDMNGQLIKTTDITTKGAGQLNVFSSDLSNGNYSYTLVVDGKIIDTKKMVKQQ